MEFKTIKNAFDRVSKKQKLASSKTQEVIEQIHQEIEEALEKLKSADDTASQLSPSSILNELDTKFKDIGPLGQLEDAQKELNIALTKYPKLLEKSLIPDISKAYRNVEFDTHTVNHIIASHFYRQGLFDIGDQFITESREPDAGSMKSSFLEMHQILSAMRNRNLEPALNWANTNRDKLKESGSDLELKLHRLQFVQILQKGTRDEALKYARSFLAPLASNHMAEIQKLMICLLWAGKLDRSPYSESLSASHWDRVAEELTRQFCNLLGQSYKSPLSVTVAAGVQGLPPILKMMNAMMTGKKQDWQTVKQLPVPLDLDSDFQFHSIFVCPVGKEPATEENPPMLMSCGHVLCRQSIMKMSKNSSKTFKCPYCPIDIEASHCKQLYI